MAIEIAISRINMVIFHSKLFVSQRVALSHGAVLQLPGAMALASATSLPSKADLGGASGGGFSMGQSWDSYGIISSYLMDSNGNL